MISRAAKMAENGQAIVMSRVKSMLPAPAKRALHKVVRASSVPRRRPAEPAQDALSYRGLCTLCGEHGLFHTAAGSKFAARAFPCPNCAATVRFRNEAAAIIDELGRGRHLSLKTLLCDPAIAQTSWYNTGIAGPVRGRLTALPNYVESHYWANGEPDEQRNGVTHQDLHELTFPDESFDVITSSHVLEHVAEPDRAFAELYRVLRPGGKLIFSIPVAWPPPETSVRRATARNGEIEHLEPAVYHESPGGVPSLVFTDYGTDLLDTLEAIGFYARQQRPHLHVELAFRDSVFVGIKPT